MNNVRNAIHVGILKMYKIYQSFGKPLIYDNPQATNMYTCPHANALCSYKFSSYGLFS